MNHSLAPILTSSLGGDLYKVQVSYQLQGQHMFEPKAVMRPFYMDQAVADISHHQDQHSLGLAHVHRTADSRETENKGPPPWMGRRFVDVLRAKSRPCGDERGAEQKPKGDFQLVMHPQQLRHWRYVGCYGLGPLGQFAGEILRRCICFSVARISLSGVVNKDSLYAVRKGWWRTYCRDWTHHTANSTEHTDHKLVLK